MRETQKINQIEVRIQLIAILFGADIRRLKNEQSARAMLKLWQ